MPRNTQKTLQRRWFVEPKWRPTLLHGPRRTNWRPTSQPPLLPLKPRRKQGHTRVPLVRSNATQDRLEERLDRPFTTANYISNPGRRKGPIHTKNNEHPQTNP